MKLDLKKHERIKGHLALRGLSFSAIARSLEITPTTVVIVSQGHRRSERVQRAIAEALGMTAEELWPDRYGLSSAPRQGSSPGWDETRRRRGSVRSASDE